MDGFQVELLRRLPLTQAVLKLFGYALDEAVLEELYESHRGRCYERRLTFHETVNLVRDALVLHGGSGHQAFVQAESVGELPVAEQNVYGKLSRLPLTLSKSLLAEGSARLDLVLPDAIPAVPLPGSLSGFVVVAFDGKKIKNAAKRLKPLRGLPGKLLGGKLLAALEVRQGLVLAMEADPDGERNDVPLVPGLLEQVRGRLDKPILWMGDRQFGHGKTAAMLAGRAGDRFLLRCAASLPFTEDLERPSRTGVDANRRGYVEAWGWIGIGGKQRLPVRRIWLTRESEEPVILLTDLLDEQRWPAVDLLQTYLERWGIERVFQQVTEVFNLQALIGSSPPAMIFQASLCFLLYNIVQVLQAYVAREAGRPRAQVSSEKLFGDARNQLVTWKEVGDPAVAVSLLEDRPGGTRPSASREPRTPQALSGWLSATLRGCWRNRWVKSPPTHRNVAARRDKPKVPRGGGGHTSTWRVLQVAKANAKRKRRS